MNEKLHLIVEVELEQPRLAGGRRPHGDDRVAAVAQAMVTQILPALAEEAGLDKERLARAVLAELGYDLGRSHGPAVAMDALAVATERLRDAVVGGDGKVVRLPAANVRGPRTIQ